MPQLAASTDRRSLITILSDTDIARMIRQAEEFDALLGETIDLLPLGALIRLSKHPRAA